ncbi:ADP-ribosylglycohydrolase family protein [Paenisporosarcina sp. TG-14]|uniref:ADP-ribosylglycohydrolase family protein n=1 Tax=Paenisporosarcina sp. TG-14 TaxID=1231057 RepID=UPI00031D80D8|nr:ADP-ribosylglycohydrolase family protein [Paenisporosarcina sp. TG-14]
MKRNQEFFRGCLIGGAIGDALGWPVEFLELNEIIKRYGPNGIQDLQLSSSGKSEITDDTQMTLFTAEGILRAENRGRTKGICHPPSVVAFAYQRWLLTQGHTRFEDYEWIYNGWLLGIKELHARRAPGNTCVSALSSRKQGSINEHINNSKGCGGVMRVAPAGLFYRNSESFHRAAEFAALTHGHPSGYLSAGALAFLIASIIEEQDIETAVKNTLIELEKHKDSEECTHILKQALGLSKSDFSDAESISKLGEGWVGEEALAISIYCALKYQDDFKKALITAVNHSGDSDSTGAITGNIVGAYLGLNSIPTDWVDKVELSDSILQIADDLLIEHRDTQEWWERYPGY